MQKCQLLWCSRGKFLKMAPSEKSKIEHCCIIRKTYNKYMQINTDPCKIPVYIHNSNCINVFTCFFLKCKANLKIFCCAFDGSNLTLKDSIASTVVACYEMWLCLLNSSKWTTRWMSLIKSSSAMASNIAYCDPGSIPEIVGEKVHMVTYFHWFSSHIKT